MLSALSLMAYSNCLDTFATALSSSATPNPGIKAVTGRWDFVPHSISGL